MRVWFYDQIGFSGANFQGRVVRAQPKYAGRWLERVALDADGGATLACPGGGVPVAAVALPLDDDGRPAGPPVPVPVDDGVARAPAAGRHRLSLFYVVTRGFDYASPEACRELMDAVHARFEERAARYLGSVIVGSFQDELPSLPTWAPDFPARFEAIAGYDPIPHLAALWEDLGPDGERFRHDFHVVRGALAEDAFFKPLSAWHDRHGLLLGFDQQDGAREGRPIASARLYGDYVRTHRWFNVPGSDHHGEAKIHSSMAHHYGHERVWIESFHTSGWGGTLEETFDWLLPWIGAGANLYDPHATYYSTRAGWWEWAPPATDWRQPVLAPLRALRARRRAGVRHADLGHPRLRRGRAVPRRHGALGPRARRRGVGRGARGRGDLRRRRRAHDVVRHPPRRAEPPRARLRRPRRRHGGGRHRRGWRAVDRLRDLPRDRAPGVPRARDGHRAPPDGVRRRGRHAGRRRRAAGARGRPAGGRRGDPRAAHSLRVRRRAAGRPRGRPGRRARTR